MTEAELRAALSRLRGQLLNAEDGELSDVRQKALDRYLGEPYGNEEDGYSQYRTREVMEAVEWALPSLLRIFTAGDKVVEFEPVGPQDEEQAEQETDVVNHYLLKENNGFMAFYEWFKDALMYPNSYAKIWTEEVTTVKTERYTGISEQGLMMLDAQAESEIVAVTPEEREVMTPQGPQVMTFFDVEVKVTKKCKKLRFESVPPDQVLVDSDLTSLSLDEARAVCHRSQRTKSWLIEAGYDKDKLDEVSDDQDDSWNSERVNRLDGQDNYHTDDEADDSMKLYWLEEWYLQIDYDGDGVAERRKVDAIGGEVFENIEHDYQPIVALSSIPLTHRHAGLSLADLVMPIQELATYLQRGINDNVSKIIRPRKYVAEGALTSDGATLDQLLDPNSEYVVVRQTGMIEPEQHQPVLSDILAVRNTVLEQSQIRTGIAPNLSLNPETLQQSTAGAYNNALQEASQRIEMIARIFAETGVREAMIKAHRQIKEHQDIPKVIKIRGKWVESDPSDWRDRENVTVNVGLGFASKEKQLAATTQLIQAQMQMMPLGLTTPENMFNALEDFVEAMGRKSPDRYFTMPQPQQQEQQQPDPLVMAQIQAITQESQRKTQETMADIQRKNAEMDAKLEKMNADTQKALADAAKAATEAGSATIRAQAEMLSPQFASDL